MSRSRKKTPIHGITTAKSEKDDKKQWHKKLRRQTRQKLKGGAEDDLPEERDVSDPWKMAKDGKTYSKDFEKARRK